MATVNVSLPEYLKAFVDAEVAARGHASASEFIHLLVVKAHLEKQRERVEALVLEGLNSGPATPMTEQDWEDIRREGLAILAEEKKHARNREEKAQRPKRPA
jgi:antitoxin ParD1/3/4